MTILSLPPLQTEVLVLQPRMTEVVDLSTILLGGGACCFLRVGHCLLKAKMVCCCPLRSIKDILMEHTYIR